MIEKRWHANSSVIWLLILILLLFLLPLQVQARKNGAGSQDLNLTSGSTYDQGPVYCGMDCHSSTSAGATISISASSCCNYTPGKAGINITATTNIPDTGGFIIGIMLLNNTNPLSGNIKNDGWVITADPWNNPTPYNYWESSVISLSQTKTWTITAPSIDGIYYMRDQGRYGKSGQPSPYIVNSSVLTLIVDGTPPQVTSRTNSIYVKTGSQLTLNASITDATSGVKNATVNVSGVNSTINEAILTLQGVYWLNTTIIADRGETALKNLTITTYDYLGNVNKSVNMTVGIDNTAPSVTSNTNYVSVANGSIITLNASITEALSGVKNATVNVSAINSTLNEVILNLQGGFWINTTIIANKGNGLVNLTITAYDNASNVNKSINMTARITPPTVTSWSNNYTSNNTLLFVLPVTTSVKFNVTANQSVSYQWTYDDIDQGQNFNNFSYLFTSLGPHYINVSVSNVNGTDCKNWTVNVVPVTIDVTLTNVPVDFGSLFAGVKNQSGLLPLNVTIESTTNVNVNLTLNGTDFISGIYNFGVGNLTYSNSSTGTKTYMATSFPLPPYINWVNLSRQVISNRSIYFWLTIPGGQESGSYSSDVNVRVERYN